MSGRIEEMGSGGSSFRRIEASEATDAELAMLCDLINEVRAELLPDDPPMPAEELRADVRSEPSYTKQFYWVLEDGGAIHGCSSLRVEFKDENKTLARVGVSVRRPLRRQGFGSSLLKEAAIAALDLDRTLVDGWVAKDRDGADFASAIGAKEEIEMYVNRLRTADVDRVLLETWVAKAQERATGYTLGWYEGATPPEDLVAMSALMKVMNTAPDAAYVEDDSFPPEQVAEYERKAVEEGWVPWTLTARSPDGELAGYTRIYPNRFRPEIVYQDDTGVVPSHRNKGVGRWLKAAMLLKIMDELPDTGFIETGNATSNAPMLAINDAIGFRPVLTWVKMSIATEQLISRLER